MTTYVVQVYRAVGAQKFKALFLGRCPKLSQTAPSGLRKTNPNIDDFTMNENENLTSISQARTLEEIGEFWDTHSLDDYWDQTHEVEFEVRAKQRRRVTLAPEIYELIASHAQLRGLMPETLVNLWLAERLQAAS